MEQSKITHSIISVDDLDYDCIDKVLTTAYKFQQGIINNPHMIGIGRIIALSFFEPSTRTSCSFSAAAQRLGCGVIYTDNVSSSIAKGETFEDTIRCLSSYSDIIVLRHPDIESSRKAKLVSSVPVINAGNGIDEHPTQALLDLYTILYRRCYRDNSSICITFIGDAKNGRTIHSLVKLINIMLPGSIVFYVTPVDLEIPWNIRYSLTNIEQYETSEMTDEILHHTDILYVTRIQKERFPDEESYMKAMKDSFIVTPSVLDKLKPTAKIMHPFPRINEISIECDNDPRSIYFKQMKNGMYVRMALIANYFSNL